MIDEDSPKEPRWQPRWRRSPVRGRTRCPRLGREVFSVRACADATLVDPRVTTWLLSERDCYCQACNGTVHRNGINAGDSGMLIWHCSLRFRISNSGWSSFVGVVEPGFNKSMLPIQSNATGFCGQNFRGEEGEGIIVLEMMFFFGIFKESSTSILF